jgi:hypothetical protein
MSSLYPNVLGSYRQSWTTGAVTTIAAGTGTAGHILALRHATAGRGSLIKSLEVSFVLTTAFGAAQRVGFDASIVRSYANAHTAATGTALTVTGGGKNARFAAPSLAGRIASAAALTAHGTPPTFDTNPICKDSFYASAIGAKMGPTFYDFTVSEQKGILLQNEEGLVVRNLILMGATGVGEWVFTCEWDEVAI